MIGHGIVRIVPALALFAAACSGSGVNDPGGTSPEAMSQRDGDSETQSADAAQVVLTPAGKPPVTVNVEVVRTPGDIQRGLMYRRYLPADAGMLFVMPEERIQSFWMKNTLIPLDMIFISSEMVVAGVVENAEPLTTTPRRVEAPSLYVLEVNGGFAGAHDIAQGTRVAFKNLR